MKRNSIIVLFSIFIFSFIYLLIFQNYGLNLWDEGVLLNGSLRTLEGESVYTNFNGYPPGRYLLGAILFKIFGINISVIRIAVAVMTAVAVVMLYSISLRLIPINPPLIPPLLKGGRGDFKGGARGGFAIIPSLLFLISPSVYYNRFYPMFTIFCIYMIFWYLEKENPSRSIILAISSILSIFFKLEIGFGIIIVSIAVMLFRKKIKELKYFFLTLSLAAMFLAFYYLRMIDIYTFLYDIYFHVFKINKSWGNPFPSVLSLNLWKNFNTHEIFSTLLFYIPLIVYFLTFIILVLHRSISTKITQTPQDVIARSRATKQSHHFEIASPEPALSDKTKIASASPRNDRSEGARNDIFLATILFFGIYTYNLVIWRTGFDNLIRCLPPALILGSYLLYLFRMKLFKWTGERILSYAVILLLPVWFLYEMMFYGDFYAGSIGEMRKTHIPLSIERAENIYTDPVEASWIKEITGHIKNNTKPEDTIFAIPLNSIWYFLTDRKNPTYYEWILPGTLKNEREEMAVIEQLKKRMPLFIIYGDVAIDNREDRRFSNYAPAIYNFMTENYHIEKRVGFFQIWRHENGSKQ